MRNQTRLHSKITLIVFFMNAVTCIGKEIQYHPAQMKVVAIHFLRYWVLDIMQGN